MRTRIGYAHLDRLLSYPDVRYLSGCSLPIRMCVGGRGLRPGRRPPHWWRVVGAERLRPPARRSRRELCSARRLEARPALWPLVCPLAGLIWIGYAHADRLLSYPDARYLSGCCLPIRMRVGGRRPGPLHSRGSAFMFVGQRCDTTEVGITPVRRWRHAPSLVSCPGLVLCGQRGWFPDNVARNSPAAAPNLDFASLELQRFEQCSKNDRGELRATFIRRGPVIPPWPHPGPAAALSAPSSLVACGALLGRVHLVPSV